MRLLRTDISQGFILDEIDVEKAPPYAILSHRWGDNEVLLGELTSHSPEDKIRFSKIIGCCRRARKDGYSHVWIDTCCIDQRSSAELSESINSMFLWYNQAAICYVHLHDVSSKQDPEASGLAFRDSEWFERGWTLQELIAPRNLVFFTQERDVIGDKRELARTIEERTKIGYGAICNCIDLADFSVAEKMSWASNRKTTKVEDRAYSLLGIFGVNMTTIYGEGQKAFQRLQYEIISQSNDYSIFAWDVYSPKLALEELGGLPTCGLLATSPDSFANSAGIISPPFLQLANQWSYQETVVDIQRTNTGIRLKAPIFEPSSSTRFTRHDACVMAIACKKREQLSSNHYYNIGVVLQLDHEGYYNRMANMGLHDADGLANSGGQWKIETIDIGIKSKRDRIDDKPSNVLTHMPRTCEVVVTTRMLNTLRRSSSPVPLEGFRFEYIWCDEAECTVKNAPEPHASGWVEDPQTKESDFVVRFPCQPGPEDSLPEGGHADHELWFSWKWGDMKMRLGISMEIGDFVACNAIRFRNDLSFDFRDFDTNWIYNRSLSKTNRYWNLNVPNRGTVGISMTLMDVTADMVRYELSLMVHAPCSLTASHRKVNIVPDLVVKSLVTNFSWFIGLRPRMDLKAAKRSAPAGANAVMEGCSIKVQDEIDQLIS